jgi:hypothetical protein
MSFAGLGGFLASLLRLALFLGTVAVMAWFAWRSRSELLDAWRQLCREWAAFWARLRGGRAAATDVPVAASHLPVERRFAEFADPFASGLAQTVSSGELVAYSFAALEAWGRERGCPRAAGQTPLEFARDLGVQQTGVAVEVLAVADLYCQHLYAGGSLPASAGPALRRFWQRLHA